MSTISVSVAFGAVIKKVSCLRGATTGQLLSLAIEKHGLSQRVGPGSLSQGQLLHNGKVVDLSLPLRFTTIANNSKLTIQIVAASNQTLTIRVKLMVSAPELSQQAVSLIADIPLDHCIADMIDQFSTTAQPSPFISDRKLQVLIANTTYLEDAYRKYTLRELVGSLIPSILVRMNYLRSEEELLERSKEQQSIVDSQLQHQLRRRQEDALEAERVAIANVSTAQQHGSNKKTTIGTFAQSDTQSRNTDATAPSPSTETCQNIKDSYDAQPIHVQARTANKHHIDPVKEAIYDNQPSSATAGTSLLESSSIDNSQNALLSETLMATSSAPELPKIFVPSAVARNDIYENPELDYTMTVSQAKAYHTSILERARPKRQSPVEPRPVLSYQIRVKFPDRTMIQIGFTENVDQVKFGQIIKKIDELLAPPHIGSYHLKYGFPPFKLLEASFDLNGKLLRDIEEFKQGQVVLVWESLVAGALPPYVKTDGDNALVMQATELPQMLVEKERVHMPQEEPEVHSYNDGDTTDSADSFKKGVKKAPGVPKWLHIR